YLFDPAADAPDFMASELDAACAALLGTARAAEAAAQAARSLDETPLYVAHPDDLAGAEPAQLAWLGVLREAGIPGAVALPLRDRAGVLLGLLAVFYQSDGRPSKI